MYEWQLGGDSGGAPLEQREVGALSRGFTRWLMGACGEMWDGISGPSSGSVFVLLRAPRGVVHPNLAPRQDLDTMFSKAKRVHRMRISPDEPAAQDALQAGQEQLAPAAAEGGEQVSDGSIWYQVGCSVSSIAEYFRLLNHSRLQSNCPAKPRT